MDKYSIDSHKLMWHPERVTKIVEAKGSWEVLKDCQPIYAELSLSGACNHRCTFCSVDYIGYKPIFIDYDVLERFLKDSATIGLKSIMFAGDGEPLLHPRVSDVIDLAHELNIDTSFTTNAVRLNKKFVERSLSKVSWIKASVNAGDAETYSRIHRTSEQDFKTVFENLSYAVQYRKDNNIECALGVQALILPDNLESLDKLCIKAIECGLDYIVFKPYVHNIYMEQPGYKDLDYSSGNFYRDGIAKLLDKYSGEIDIVARFNALDKLEGTRERYKTCWSTPSLWFYVSGNSDVYACGAHIGNPLFLLGNINTDSIASIWKSESRKSCLSHVQNDLDLNTCRRTCRMDEANAYIEQIIDQTKPHINFI